MGKLVDDAKAVADAASNLVAEAETEESGTVTDKTVTKITVTYSDGSSVDFSPAGNDTPAAPVVTPVMTDAPVSTPDTTEGVVETPAETTATETPAEVAEGGTEVEPTAAGSVPQS